MDVWDKNVKVESNLSFNSGDPIITKRISKTKNKFIHIDLFSGCGGFSCGFEQSGFVTELAIDIHEQSIDTINRNHKNTSTILGDIRKIKPLDTKKFISDLEAQIVYEVNI